MFRRFLGSLTGPNPATMSAAQSKVMSIIADNNVVVFSKSYCSYSRATKSLLNEQGIPFFVLELDQIEDGDAIQDALAEISHQRTVPNIFIGQKHIGGNSDLQARKAELPALLSAAAAAKASKA
ncbi:glutaredoxin [Emergomyces africanus]|uniref:Glutaredoxin n=1 Tax=Emergomyces africanus TaxID=1955775 RepID=A0A1B7P6H6_9EURO|nr:glutaredoxin [Emergomyces africanus]